MASTAANNASFRKQKIECHDLVVINSSQLGVTKSVTQGTSLATAVTLNGTIGKITLFGVLAADGSANSAASFTVNNTSVSSSSVILVTAIGSSATADTTRNAITCDIESIAHGSFVVHISNNDAAATAAAPVIQFLIC